MTTRARSLLISSVLISGLWLAFLAAGLDLVPFHPDETSLLFQSRDLELAQESPLSLAWNPEREMTQELEYRLLNAPLAKYALGIARGLAGIPAESVEVDWNWSQTWPENLAAGALPERRALLVGRTVSLMGLAAGGIFLALWGVRVGGPLLAGLTALSYGLSAYQYLHGRRAMAEGLLLATICFWIFSSAHLRSRPWLLGIASALSLAAKHSAAPLLLVGGLFAFAIPAVRKRSLTRALRSLAVYMGAAVALFFALNPVMWTHPAGAVRAAVQVRADLVERQQRDRLPAGSVISSPLQRIAAPLGLIFVTDLQFQEVGNYASELEHAIEAYRSVPGHALDRGPAAGALRMTLVLFGAYLALRTVVRGETKDPNLLILLIASAAQLAALAMFNPLPFQRYYAPVLPFVHVFTAWGIYEVIRTARPARPAVQPGQAVNHAGNRREAPEMPGSAGG